MNKELQDKTWAVLPNEFREEVKKIYNDLLNEHITPDIEDGVNNRMLILEEIFSYHNLTFDAQKDVEFLQEENTSNNTYKSLKDKCWVEYRRHATSNVESLKYWYDIVFESAYNLGKQQSINYSINWEQRRFELVKSILPSIIRKFGYIEESTMNMTIKQVDFIIKKLKENENTK